MVALFKSNIMIDDKEKVTKKSPHQKSINKGTLIINCYKLYGK